jgi:CRP/FNR family transcriptional regulator, cyclic AMP receptor protein
MSELLARTLARALPLFARRWQDEAREREPPGHFDTPQPSAPWSLLVDAVRSGAYRPVIAAIRGGGAHDEERAHEAWSQLSLLAECVRTTYDGDPRDLPVLLREMESVREILTAAVQRGTETEHDAPPPPIIDAMHRSMGIVPSVTIGYEPGETICTREDRDPILYCVRSGHVRLTEPLPDGRMVTLSILGAGGVFGTVDVPPRHGISAEAMTHCDVTLLHASQLSALVRIAPEAVHAVIASLTAQLRDARALVAHALAHDTSVRLVTILLTLADAFGEAASGGKTLIAYPTTHQNLADMIGANRVTVTRKLIELQKADLIVPERRNMLLVDASGLAGLLNQ